LVYNSKLDLFILIILVYSAELLTDFSYTNFTVSYRDALERLHVHLNISTSRSTNTPIAFEVITLNAPYKLLTYLLTLSLL